MRLLLALVGVSTAIGFAVPAHADPGVDDPAADPAFLAALRGGGITFTDPGQAVTAGKAVCGLIGTGESGLELLNDLRAANPALALDSAARFATIAARSYCPQQLEPSGGAAK